MKHNLQNTTMNIVRSNGEVQEINFEADNPLIISNKYGFCYRAYIDKYKNMYKDITFQKKRVRRVLAFESPKKIYSNKKDNFPSLKIFHENAEKMKINNIREMTPEEKALHFSMEPQPIRPSNNWAPHRFNSY